MSCDAIILAAGLGARMGTLAQEVPKALLPLGPRAPDDPTPTCLLRRSAEQLHAAGASPIVIVVGALAEVVRERARTWGLPLHFVTNTSDDISTSGSLHSFQFAIRSEIGVLDGSRQTLLLDADILYPRQALDALLCADVRSALLYRQGPRQDDEQVCVYGTETQPRFLGKALRAPLVGDAPCLGEATGIVKLATQDHALVRQTVDWMVGDPDAAPGSAARRGYGPARQATEHEELTQRMMHYGRMTAVGLAPDVPFTECDDADDYARARALHAELIVHGARGKGG